MKKSSTARQQLIDALSRDLDQIEKTTPMLGSYERIDPFFVDQHQAGISFEIIVYNIESREWYQHNMLDAGMLATSSAGVLKEGDVVFDIGCNSGQTSAWFGLKVGHTGKVVAFDPFPWNALAARYQAKINYLDNVEVYTVGIGDKESSFPISLVDARTVQSVTGSGSFMAKIEPLSKFQHYRPTFLKIDCEGAEAEIALTDPSVLSTVRDGMLEFHKDFVVQRGAEPLAVLQKFKNMGFTLHGGHPLSHAYPLADPSEATLSAYWLRRAA
jgi:FkbM family methyltransferase